MKRRCAEWHQSTARATREQMDPMLSNSSRGTLMSYTGHSAQRRFKSNTPINRRESETNCHVMWCISTEAKLWPQDHNKHKTVMDTSNINISMNVYKTVWHAVVLQRDVKPQINCLMDALLFSFFFFFFASFARTCRFHEFLARHKMTAHLVKWVNQWTVKVKPIKQRT